MLMVASVGRGTDELYYTFDPNYQGQPTNQYFIDIGPNDSSFDITDAGMFMAEYGCGSSCWADFS